MENITKRGILVSTHNYNYLQSLGVFRSAEAKEKGVGASNLAWLVKKGEVKKIGSDAYHHATIFIDPEISDYVAACTLFRDSCYVGGFTALAHYNLIDNLVTHIWLVVDPQCKSSNTMYRLIRTKADKHIGINKKEWFSMATIERAILDAFYFEKKLGGLTTALSSARRALAQDLTTFDALFDLAKQLGWQKRMLNGAMGVIFDA